jgi:transitional endoplasmic reticulum ATPase
MSEPKKKETHWDKHDVDIVRKGSMITLPAAPEPMGIDNAIKALRRKKRDEEQEIQPIEFIDAFPLDGAVAFMRAMQEMFGWASPVPTPGFFGSSNPPKFVGVQVSVTETVQVAFGRFELPNVSGHVETHVSRGKFVISGEIQKKDGHIVNALAKRTREIVKSDSIYRGKALNFKTDSKGQVDFDEPPVFLDTRQTKVEELILNEDTHEIVNTSIFNPIRHTDKCRQVKIPLNRSALLEGTYGVGKTMIAKATAKVCEENGWTFLLLDKAEALKEGLLFAQRYSPAVVFCEDIDRVTNERDEDANDLLNTIDGIVTKDAEVIAVMTTNHVEDINKAMLRPGRLDSVISITPPDAQGIDRLLRLYGRDLIPEEEPLEEVCNDLAGQIPATVREVIERAKLRAIPMMNGSGLAITGADLLAASREMKLHLSLLNREDVQPPTAAQKIADGLKEVIAEAGVVSLEQTVEQVDELYDHIVN